MPVQPNTRLEQLQFVEEHWPVWLLDPTKIGLTVAEVNDLKVAAIAARTQYNNQQTAKNAAKAATQAFYDQSDELRSKTAAAIRAIKFYADSTNDPNVYVAAQIPAPLPPSPVAPPSQPTNIRAIIQPGGALTLEFKATSAAAGAVYLVKRKLAGQSNFQLIGTAQNTRSAVKTFTDFTLPANANNIQYIIQGQRGQELGPDSSVFVVTLGAAGGPSVAMYDKNDVRLAA